MIKQYYKLQILYDELLIFNICIVSLVLLVSLSVFGVYVYAENWNVFLNPYDGIQNDELFVPLELPISSEDTVTWRNHDSVTHKIVSGVPAHPDYSGEFFSTGILSPGEHYSVSLPFRGFAGYYYFCEIHPWYTGKVFFEDNPDIYHSTLDISYSIDDSETLIINGLVEPDLGNTNYEIMIFDSKNNLIFQKISSFESDASFVMPIDISNSIWGHDENYLLKLVYSVPSESTNLSLHIPMPHVDDVLKTKSLNACENSDGLNTFVFEETVLPSWYKTSLCWFNDNLFTQKELFDSLSFLNQFSQT